MKEFDFYEIVAVLCPGVILTMGIIYFFPNVFGNFNILQDISLGGIAIGLIIAYVVGQYVQYLGTWLEKLVWLKNGKPSDWIKQEGHLIKGEEYKRLVNYLQQDNINIASDSDSKYLHARVRAIVKDEDRRLYILNSQYGMFRGLSCVWIIIFMFSTIRFQFCHINYWVGIIALLTVICISICRMRSFGIHYAHNLYSKYMNISVKEKTSRCIQA